MKAFDTPGTRMRKRERWLLQRNPVPGRTSSDYQYISRTLDKIAARIAFWLDTTEEQPFKWLPFDEMITEQDDDMQYEIEAQYLADYEAEDTGYMLHYHDPGIKATNTIQVISWYESEDTGNRMLICKKIRSPLPCSTWGRLPITATQWKKIAPALIDCHCLWQWVHGVRQYQNDDSIKLGGVMGWHLQDTEQVVSILEMKTNGKGYFIDGRSEEDQAKDIEGWPGVNIYQDIIGAYSQRKLTG